MTRDSLVHKARTHEMRIFAQVSVLVALGIHGRLQKVWRSIGCYDSISKSLKIILCHWISWRMVNMVCSMFVPSSFHLNCHPKSSNLLWIDMMLELRTWWAITLCPSCNWGWKEQPCLWLPGAIGHPLLCPAAITGLESINDSGVGKQIKRIAVNTAPSPENHIGGTWGVALTVPESGIHRVPAHSWQGGTTSRNGQIHP